MQRQLLSIILVILLVTLLGGVLFFTRPTLAFVQVLNLFALTSFVNTGRT